MADDRSRPRNRSSELPTKSDNRRQARERYVPGDEIGRGGMGRVFEAFDASLERTVAVKEALGTDWDAVSRFQREMTLTAELEHPAIVAVYDRGRSSNGRPFYVMRRLSGRPLSSLVAERHTLVDRLALLPTFVSAVNAVAYAHSRRIIHRDLKPNNILVGEYGGVSVIDWGLAKRLDEPSSPEPAELSDKTTPGSVLGSPGYMSAEQARGLEVDERADVFALGCCLYFLLSGVAPHGQGTAEQLLLRAEHPVPPLAEVMGGVPPPLLAIVDNSLAYHRENRFADAQVMATELQHFLASQLAAAYHHWLAGQ